MCWNEQALHLVWQLQPHVLCLTDPIPKTQALGPLRLPADICMKNGCVSTPPKSARVAESAMQSQGQNAEHTKIHPGHKMISVIYKVPLTGYLG